MYNLITKYSMYKKGRRGLRPDSLAWHKAREGVGERPFPKLALCMDLARWMRTFGKRCWPAEWQRAGDLSKRV